MKVPVSGKVINDQDKDYAHQAVNDGWLTEGRWSLRFQAAFSNYMGVRKTILTNSGSSANLIALSALTSIELGERRILPGDEVITTALNFPTTLNPILQIGAVPVFVDVNLPTLVTDIERVERAFSPKTKAVVLAHTLGYGYDCGTLAKWAREKNIFFVEDCCDALGGETPQGKLGTFGDFATFSFYPAHQMTCGEGGAAITGSPLLAKLATSFRDWGRACWCETGMDNTCGNRYGGEYDHKYQYDRIGYNLKLTDIQAAILCSQLQKLDEFTLARRRNHKFLVDAFQWKGLDRYFDFVKDEGKDRLAWFGFTLTCKEGVDRNKLCRWLDGQGIGNRPVFAGNVLRQPAYKGIVHRTPDTLVNTDVAHERSFWVGCWHGLSVDQLEYMVERFVEYFK